MNDNQPRSADDIAVDCTLEFPPERVWRALIEPELLARWLLPNDFRPEVGHVFGFVPDQRLEGGPIACEVLELEPERRLKLSWRSADVSERDPVGNRLDSVVTFELEPVARGTRLRIAHTGFPAGAVPLQGAGRRLTTMLALGPATRMAA
jgi:uncharacterized protein YndB with AHSA1/START domain